MIQRRRSKRRRGSQRANYFSAGMRANAMSQARATILPIASEATPADFGPLAAIPFRRASGKTTSPKSSDHERRAWLPRPSRASARELRNTGTPHLSNGAPHIRLPVFSLVVLRLVLSSGGRLPPELLLRLCSSRSQAQDSRAVLPTSLPKLKGLGVQAQADGR
jgi:hypothetical protein